MFKDSDIKPIVDTYRQQGSALSSQHDFADFMFDQYLSLALRWNYDTPNVKDFVFLCRQVVKFSDMRDRLDLDMDVLLREQDFLTSYLSAKDANK